MDEVAIRAVWRFIGVWPLCQFGRGATKHTHATRLLLRFMFAACCLVWGLRMIEFQCEMCDAEYSVDDDRAGMLARCKECGQELTVPPANPCESEPGESKPVATVPGDLSCSPEAEPAIDASPTSKTPTSSSSPSRPVPPLPASVMRSWSSFSTPEGRKAARLGRPLDPGAEESNRKRNVVIVGIMLIVGFLMPVCVASPMSTSMRLSLVNIEALGQSGIGWQGVFSMLFPLVAGIVTLVAVPLAPRKRGAVLIAMAVSQVVVVVIALDGFGLGQVLGPNLNVVAFVYVLFLGMIWGLLAGCRARWYRPNAKPAYAVGVTGALCTLVLYFAPFEGPPAISNVFRLVSLAPVMGALLVLATLLIIGAALISLVNVPSRQLESSSNTARLTFVILLLSFGACLLLLLVWVMESVDHAGMVVSVITVCIKGVCWIGGMMLLLPMGITDLIVGDAAIDYSRCIKCNYDLRAAADRMCPECGLQNPV